MKKHTLSITALLLVITITFTGVPLTAHAKEYKKVNTIRNVKVIYDNVTFWGGEPYVIYEVDGTIHDSRYMSQGFNMMAWKAMSVDDRRTVNRRYWQLNKRQEAFGDQFAEYMGTWSDETLNYTSVKAALDAKWEARYAGDMLYIFGDDYYESAYNGIANYTEDSAANTIINNYRDDPLAKEFLAKYKTSTDLMYWGKTFCYDKAVKAVLQIRALGVKAISKELIGIIVSNFLTPTMTMMGASKPVGLKTDLYTKLYDLLDSKLSVTGTIHKYTVGKTVSTDDAVAAINSFDELVTHRFEVAEECYTAACELKAQLEEEAPELLATLENRHPGDQAVREACELEREARGDKVENPSAEVSSESEGYSDNYEVLKEIQDTIMRLSGDIAALEEQGGNEEHLADLKNQLRVADEQLEDRKGEMERDNQDLMNAWHDEMMEAINDAIEEAGFEIYPEDYEFTPEQIEEYDLEYHGKLAEMHAAAAIDNKDYYSYDGYYAFAPDTNEYHENLYSFWDVIPPSGLQVWENDLDTKDIYMQSKAAMLRKLADCVPTLFNTFYESYQPIAASALGYDDAIYVYPYEDEGEIPGYNGLLLVDDNRAMSCLAMINAIPNDLTECASYERYVSEFKANEFANAQAESQEYAQWLSDTVTEYNGFKSDFDLAWVEYCNDLAQAKNVYNNQVPQYVKDLTTDPYRPTDIDRNLKAYIDGQSNPKNFLKTEAKKMDDLYDQFLAIRDELDIDQTYLGIYFSQMTEIENSLKMDYADPDNSYWTKEYSLNELLQLFEVNSVEQYLKDDPLYYEEGLVSRGNNGIIYTTDEDILERYSITPDQLTAINRMPVLSTDFYGGTDYHAEFEAVFEELKNRQGTIIRQMAEGDYDLYNEYKTQLINAYTYCESRTYNSRYAGLAGNKTIDMYEETQGTDGILLTLHRVARSYTPVTDLVKYRKQNILMSGAGSDEEQQEQQDPDIAIKPGGSARLIAQVVPSDATYKDVIWSSLDRDIVEVDDYGVVTGVSEGIGKIQAIAADTPSEVTFSDDDPSMIDEYEIPEEYVLTYIVAVDENAPEPSDVESIELIADKTALGDGDMATITGTVTPDDASAYLSWSVSPENVAAIAADEESEFGSTAEGWRVFVKGVSSGTATITATAENGKKSSIQIQVKQKLLQVCDVDGNVEKYFESFADAREWINQEFIEDTDKIHVIRLMEDVTVDEEAMAAGESDFNYGYATDKVIFELMGHTLTVKRSRFSPLTLNSGVVMRNGTLEVLGEDGLSVYGNITLDKVVTSRFQVCAEKGELCNLDSATLTGDFIMLNDGACEIKTLNSMGDIVCYEQAQVFADTINIQGGSWIADDAFIAANDSCLIAGDIILNNGSNSAYIARYKDAELTLNGNIEPNTGDMKLSVGVTATKLSAADLPEGEMPAVMELNEQTLLFHTTQNKVSKYVKVWQPQGSTSKFTYPVLAARGVYAASEGAPVIEPEEEEEVKPITKLMLDKISCSIGTDKEITLTATALSEDADRVYGPPVTWIENKNGKVIAITGFDPIKGTVTVKGLSSGTATLTATTTDGSNKKAACTIKVGTSIEQVTIIQKKKLNSVEAGKKLTLTADILPKKPAPIVKTLIWESSDPAVAAVDAKGGVTGISAGKATITARPANNVYDATKETASFEVTVTEATKAVAVGNIIIKKAVPELAVGKSVTLKAYTHNAANNKDVALNSKSVVFYSSDENVLSVTPAGKMTAKAEGSATITAVSLADPSIKAEVPVDTYVAVKKIVLNATKGKVKKGKTGIVTVAQWNPEDTTYKQVKWTATGADGSVKAGNMQAIEIAVLDKDKTISDLTDDDFVDARTTPVITEADQRIAYRTLVATKKCVITATTVEGNKTAKYTLQSLGEVTSLKLKTSKTVTESGDGYAASVKPGKSLKVSTVVQAEYGADKSLVWTSDSPDIVTVSGGTIKVAKTAAKGSTAVVTATTANKKHSVRILVTVN